MNIGNRIKRYELASSYHLTSRVPVVIRVDGKAFHTYTKYMQKPFDNKLIDAMISAGKMTAMNMSGFKLGYHQSDEFTFLLTDYDTYETQPWFDYKLQKLASITASMFTAFFNDALESEKIAFFDARAFNVPVDDVPNVFIWRQRDWERNSLQMLCRSVFSHNQLTGKKKDDMHEMLHIVGMNWNDLDMRLKNGTFITSSYWEVSTKQDYEGIKNLINLSEMEKAQ